MRKKKYFVGGAVNKGIQGLTQDMPGQSSQVIGGAAQLAIGAATGNPMDMIGGGVDMLSGGFNNAKEMFNNKDASFGDKALAAYGVINPMAGVVSSFKNKSRAFCFEYLASWLVSSSIRFSHCVTPNSTSQCA